MIHTDGRTDGRTTIQTHRFRTFKHNMLKRSESMRLYGRNMLKRSESMRLYGRPSVRHQ